MAQPERMDPANEMPSLPRALTTNDDLDAEWGNQVVSYLGALNGKVDNMGHRLEAKIDGVRDELEAKIDGLDAKIDRVRDELEAKFDGLDAKIDGVNDNIERLFQRVYPNVDFE